MVLITGMPLKYLRLVKVFINDSMLLLSRCTSADLKNILSVRVRMNTIKTCILNPKSSRVIHV